MTRRLHQRRRGRQRGFTMLELLVTLLISVFALLGILALHNSLSNGTTRAGQTQEAVVVGAQVIEELRGKRPGDLSVAVTGSTTSPPFSNTTFKTVLGRNGIAYPVGVAVTAPHGGGWLLHVDMTWTNDVSGDTTTLYAPSRPSRTSNGSCASRARRARDGDQPPQQGDRVVSTREISGVERVPFNRAGPSRSRRQPDHHRRSCVDHLVELDITSELPQHLGRAWKQAGHGQRARRERVPDLAE